MHGQHITITANNANNKIENVDRAAGLGFFQKKTFFQDSKKNPGINLVASSLFQKKLGEIDNWNCIRVYVYVCICLLCMDCFE